MRNTCIRRVRDKDECCQFMVSHKIFTLIRTTVLLTMSAGKQ